MHCSRSKIVNSRFSLSGTELGYPEGATELSMRLLSDALSGATVACIEFWVYGGSICLSGRRGLYGRQLQFLDISNQTLGYAFRECLKAEVAWQKNSHQPVVLYTTWMRCPFLVRLLWLCSACTLRTYFVFPRKRERERQRERW